MKKKDLKRKNKEMRRDMKTLYNEFTNLCFRTQELLEDYDDLVAKQGALELCCAKLLTENSQLKEEISSINNNVSLSIEKVNWENDKTTVTWSDGTSTMVTRQKGEKYDRQSAIAYAIAKKVLGNTSVANVVENFSEDNSKDEKYVKIYKALNSKTSRNRIKAQKEWEKIPQSKRQSIKARVANAK